MTKKKPQLRLLDHSSALSIINYWYGLDSGVYKIDATDVVSYVPARHQPAKAILIVRADGTSTLITPTMMQAPAPDEYLAQD